MEKLLAESLEEFRTRNKSEETNELNEGLFETKKNMAQKYLKDPVKFAPKFAQLFKEQFRMMPILKELADSLSPEEKAVIVKKALEHLEANPSLDILQLPFQRAKGGLILDLKGDVSGRGVQARSGIHGGSTVKG